MHVGGRLGRQVRPAPGVVQVVVQVARLGPHPPQHQVGARLGDPHLVHQPLRRHRRVGVGRRQPGRGRRLAGPDQPEGACAPRRPRQPDAPRVDDDHRARRGARRSRPRRRCRSRARRRPGPRSRAARRRARVDGRLHRRQAAAEQGLLVVGRYDDQHRPDPVVSPVVSHGRRPVVGRGEHEQLHVVVDVARHQRRQPGGQRAGVHRLGVQHPAGDRMAPVAEQHDAVRVERRRHPLEQPVEVARGSGSSRPRTAPPGRSARRATPTARRAPSRRRAPAPSRGPAPRPRAAVDRQDRVAPGASSAASAPREQPTSRARAKRSRGSAASVSARLRRSYHRCSTPHGSSVLHVQVVEGEVDGRLAHEELGQAGEVGQEVGAEEHLVAGPVRERRGLGGVGGHGRGLPGAGLPAEGERHQLLPRRLGRVAPSARTRPGTRAAGRRCAPPRRPRRRRPPRGPGARRGARGRPASTSRASPSDATSSSTPRSCARRGRRPASPTSVGARRPRRARRRAAGPRLARARPSCGAGGSGSAGASPRRR